MIPSTFRPRSTAQKTAQEPALKIFFCATTIFEAEAPAALLCVLVGFGIFFAPFQQRAVHGRQPRPEGNTAKCPYRISPMRALPLLWLPCPYRRGRLFTPLRFALLLRRAGTLDDFHRDLSIDPVVSCFVFFTCPLSVFNTIGNCIYSYLSRLKYTIFLI